MVMKNNYMDYVCALYGDSNKAEKLSKVSRSRSDPTNPTEDDEQAKLHVWLTREGIRHYAIPNGGKRNYVEAIKFKRTGVSSGVPDICIPYPMGLYHGLYIELKRAKGGKVSDSQTEWLAFLTKNGYLAQVAEGFEKAKEIVLYYFSLRKTLA
jgi:hypothetical protein